MLLSPLLGESGALQVSGLLPARSQPTKPALNCEIELSHCSPLPQRSRNWPACGQ